MHCCRGVPEIFGCAAILFAAMMFADAYKKISLRPVAEQGAMLWNPKVIISERL